MIVVNEASDLCDACVRSRAVTLSTVAPWLAVETGETAATTYSVTANSGAIKSTCWEARNLTTAY